MNRLLVPLVLVATMITAVGCGDDGGVVVGPAQADIDDEAPYGPGIAVGENYEYVLYTHCGIKWARIDGAWWRTTPLDDGNANPPPGWGNPYDAGLLRISDDTTAKYEGGPGTTVEFVRTESVEAPFTCE